MTYKINSLLLYTITSNLQHSRQHLMKFPTIILGIPQLSRLILHVDKGFIPQHARYIQAALISSSSSSSSNTADMMSTHTNEAPQSPFVHSPFRVLRTLGVGGYAKAVAAQDIPSNHLMCIKVFQKHNLKHKHTALSVSKELGRCRVRRLKVLKSRQYGIACKKTMTAKDKPAKSFSWHILSGRSVSHLVFSRHWNDETPKTTAKKFSWHISSGRSVRWIVQLALGINALHELGIIHRDIRAENILLDVRENLSSCRRKALGLTRGVFDKRGWNALVLHGTGDPPIQLIQPRFYDVRTTRRLARFKTQRHTLDYAAWCTSNGETHRQFSFFQNLKGNLGDLICGLLDSYLSSRYGFNEVSGHRLFLRPCGTSESFNAYSCALKRSEVPESLPDLRCGQEPAKVLQRLAPWEHPRVLYVDWFKPA
ncbi:hypothetical protein EDD22DRAFT_1052457 [Suillus occidentalis]|nr:hypothetical protein EDD22DRAFT_1052457 [Suillus occidentalis]